MDFHQTLEKIIKQRGIDNIPHASIQAIIDSQRNGKGQNEEVMRGHSSAQSKCTTKVFLGSFDETPSSRLVDAEILASLQYSIPKVDDPNSKTPKPSLMKAAKIDFGNTSSLCTPNRFKGHRIVPGRSITVGNTKLGNETSTQNTQSTRTTIDKSNVDTSVKEEREGIPFPCSVGIYELGDRNHANVKGFHSDTLATEIEPNRSRDDNHTRSQSPVAAALDHSDSFRAKPHSLAPDLEMDLVRMSSNTAKEVPSPDNVDVMVHLRTDEPEVEPRSLRKCKRIQLKTAPVHALCIQKRDDSLVAELKAGATPGTLKESRGHEFSAFPDTSANETIPGQPCQRKLSDKVRSPDLASSENFNSAVIELATEHMPNCEYRLQSKRDVDTLKEQPGEFAPDRGLEQAATPRFDDCNDISSLNLLHAGQEESGAPFHEPVLAQSTMTASQHNSMRVLDTPTLKEQCDTPSQKSGQPRRKSLCTLGLTSIQTRERLRRSVCSESCDYLGMSLLSTAARPSRLASDLARARISEQLVPFSPIDYEIFEAMGDESEHTRQKLSTNKWVSGATRRISQNNSKPRSGNQDIPVRDIKKRAKRSRGDSLRFQKRSFGQTDVKQPNAKSKPDVDDAARWLNMKVAKEKLTVNDTVDHLATYVEDIAWRRYAFNDEAFEQVHPLPPPEPLPPLIADDDEQSCTFVLDTDMRVLRATVKSGTRALSRKTKDYLFTLMERDDMAVVTSGLCPGLDVSLWNSQSIKATSGEMYHHRFRRFKPVVTEMFVPGRGASYCEYEEIAIDATMKVSTFVQYLEERKKFLKLDVQGRNANREFVYLDNQGDDVKLNLDEAVYMLDYDIKKKLPLHYQDFKDTFLLPEILPGGKMCAMNSVNEAARPDMGPNLYITPPGTFTRFHRDGYGTVDSGHLCLSGYNEVVILRRLPKGHDRMAAKGNELNEMPHSDYMDTILAGWPSKAEIKRLRKLNYCPIVLILGPGEHLHIGKGRLHSFRKLCAQTLPEDDCHCDLRKELHSKLTQEGKDVRTFVNISLAWDWSFLGFTAQGINREMVATLEFALGNRKGEKTNQSLAIPKLCLLSCCKSSIAAHRSHGDSFGIDVVAKAEIRQHHLDTIKGLLAALEFVVTQELEAAQLSPEIAAEQVQLMRPHAWENPVSFPLDPYGNSDYFCKICSQELSNSYMHCDGCEVLLKKDFNICADCHTESRNCEFYFMSEKDFSLDSAFHHAGNFPLKEYMCSPCSEQNNCSKCGGCRKCSCICHSVFTLQRRLWNCETLSDILAEAKAIVSGDKIPFYDEVMPRLREALLSKYINNVENRESGEFVLAPAGYMST